MTWKWVKGPSADGIAEGVAIPVAEIDGGQPGPTWLLTAGVHGDEYEGPAAIRRAVMGLVAQKGFAGRVIALPVCNPFAYSAGVRLTPADAGGEGLRGNLNRAFPGRADGSLTERWADWLWRTFMMRSDRLVDLHAGGAAFKFDTVAGFYRDEDAPLAAMLGLTMWRAPETEGVLSREFRVRRGPAIGAELGWGGGRDEAMVEQISKALVRLVHGEAAAADSVGPVYANHDIASLWTGEWSSRCELRQSVSKGDVLGEVHGWDGTLLGEVRAPLSGRVLAVRRILSVSKSDLVVGIGVAEKRG